MLVVVLVVVVVSQTGYCDVHKTNLNFWSSYLSFLRAEITDVSDTCQLHFVNGLLITNLNSRLSWFQSEFNHIWVLVPDFDFQFHQRAATEYSVCFSETVLLSSGGTRHFSCSSIYYRIWSLGIFDAQNPETVVKSSLKKSPTTDFSLTSGVRSHIPGSKLCLPALSTFLKVTRTVYIVQRFGNQILFEN